MENSIEDAVRADLRRLEERIQAILCCEPQLLTSVGKHLMASRGKRIRPILSFLSARIGDPDGDLLATAAASIELIHTATLLHDDSIDQSHLRRGAPTVNYVWDDHTSVVVGDYLYCTAFRMLHENRLPEVAALLSYASQMLTLGELFQMDWRGRLDVSEDMYLEMVRLKTASLFSSACEIGAILGDIGIPEREALKAYGENLGIAFQIVDDVLDFVGDVGKMGKPVGNDLRDGRLTLPLIASIRVANPEIPVDLNGILVRRKIAPAEWERIVEFVISSGGVRYSMDLAASFAEKAKQSLCCVRACNEKQLLEKISRMVISRQS
ncbi:MAG: polyprenyl synthetase family protein [bacterium]